MRILDEKRVLTVKHSSGIMLVLNRKSKESIQIGNDIVVTVLEIRHNRVQIGIDAPKQVRVLRTELLTAISALPTCVIPTVVVPIES